MQNEVFGEAYKAGLSLEQHIRKLQPAVPTLERLNSSLQVTFSLRDIIYADAIWSQCAAIIGAAADAGRAGSQTEVLREIVIGATEVQKQLRKYLKTEAPNTYERLSKTYNITDLD